MDNKTDLRLYAREARKALDIENISDKIVRKIQASKVYKSANHVMLFYPMHYEIDLRKLFDDDKKFYLPKVSGENILACPYPSELVKSAFDIMEPTSTPVNPGILDLVIVPCLMADKKGYRLGYGGGYYDRFLTETDAYTITVVPNQLYVTKLPREEYDIKIDKVIHM